MANTYTLINSTTLSTTAASVTFSAIPATYDDLVLSISARGDRSSIFEGITWSINGGPNSWTKLFGNGSSAASDRGTGTIDFDYALNGSTSTSSTFSNVEFYIPSYRTTGNKKPVSFFGVVENNNTTAYVTVNAALSYNTTAISSISLGLQNGPNFLSGSSFYLYGIKNS